MLLHDLHVLKELKKSVPNNLPQFTKATTGIAYTVHCVETLETTVFRDKYLFFVNDIHPCLQIWECMGHR